VTARGTARYPRASTRLHYASHRSGGLTDVAASRWEPLGGKDSGARAGVQSEFNSGGPGGKKENRRFYYRFSVATLSVTGKLNLSRGGIFIAALSHRIERSLRPGEAISQSNARRGDLASSRHSNICHVTR